MHLLAHLLLHRRSTTVDESELHAGDDTEFNAARLARHILVPDTFLTGIGGQRQTDDVATDDTWVRSQQQKWGVSADLVLQRLVDAKRMSQASYMAYRARRKQTVAVRASRRVPQQSLHDLGQKYGETFVRTVLDALDRRLITIPKASRYLDGVNLDELHALERSYADN
jgi:Zn-dependent peptidase ImmA (M78 family)